MKEYLAYKGEKFTIEWYFSPKGESQPLEIINTLSTVEQQRFFFEGKKIIITNAFVKKSQKLKKQDKDCAVNARIDYAKRIKEAIYYDKDYEYI